MKRLVVPLLAAVVAATLMISCTQAPPPPATNAPLAVPTKPPEPTRAAEPTKAAAPPTAAPTAAPAPQPTPAPKVDYPQKGRAVTVIVPSAAGGSMDVGARVLSSALEKDLGVPFQVANRTGGGGQTGITDMVKSRPDGYTLGFLSMQQTISSYLDPERKAAYTRKDVVQVANQMFDPTVLAVRADAPYKSLKDLVDATKATPDKIRVAVAGIGSQSHTDGLLFFQRAAGVKVAFVQFDGAAPGITAVRGNHVEAVVATLGNFPAVLGAGDMRLLGVMDAKRSKFVPAVPTFEEQGYKLASGSSRGVSAPGGTPREIVELLSRAIKKAMDTEEHRKMLDAAWIPERYLDAAAYTAYWDQAETDLKPLMELIRLEK